jgi:hypothetical protein
VAFRSTEVMQIVAVLQLADRFYEQKQPIVSDNEGGQAYGAKLRRRPELRTLTELAANAAIDQL